MGNVCCFEHEGKGEDDKVDQNLQMKELIGTNSKRSNKGIRDKRHKKVGGTRMSTSS